MLKYRLIFGPVMIALLLAIFYFDQRLDQVAISGTFWQSLFFGRPYLPAGLLMLALFLTVIPFGALELCAIFKAKEIPAQRSMVCLAGWLGCLSMYMLPADINPQRAVAILATLVVLLFLATLVRHSYRGHRTQGAVAAASATMFSLIYMGLLPGFWILIRRWHSPWVILGLILITKACDIGAYFTGRAIGRNKLIPWLSPGKTWEGLLGGIVLSVLTAVFLAWLGHQLGVTGTFSKYDWNKVWTVAKYPWWAAACTGALLAVVGQFGDLVASLFKRDAGIKDSGSSIPGFGGLLDVVDSPLVVAPLAYWIMAALQPA